eukprot:5230006-Pleurochrysis_carterae.AAC.2
MQPPYSTNPAAHVFRCHSLPMLLPTFPPLFAIHQVKSAIKDLLTWPEVESLLVWAVKRDLLSLRIDYKSGRLNQQPSQTDAVASGEVRDSLYQFALAMDAVAEKLRAGDIEKRKKEVRAELYGSFEAGMEEEHQKILSRRLIIERRKEEAERVAMEEKKEKQRLRAEAKEKEEAEERERVMAEARRREKERIERERAEEEAAQMRKLAEQMAEQRKAMKVTKKKGGETGKVETDVDKLAEKDRNELMREQARRALRAMRHAGRKLCAMPGMLPCVRPRSIRAAMRMMT